MVAKTCPWCGQLCQRDDYRLSRTGSRSTYCRSCEIARFKKVQNTNDYAARYQRERNAELREHANRDGLVWTGAELEIAARTDLSHREVAEMLGRTFNAVRYIRRQLRVDPRVQAML